MHADRQTETNRATHSFNKIKENAETVISKIVSVIQIMLFKIFFEKRKKGICAAKPRVEYS